MARIIEVTALCDPQIRHYARLTESQLRSPEYMGEEPTVFVCESPKVIRVALQAGYKPMSLLCERRHITGDASDIIEGLPADFPVYTGEGSLLEQLTGYRLTRGVLCAMERPSSPQPVLEMLRKRERSRIVVINGVVDATNIGAIFRSAAALGIDAVVLTHTSCDPLNRRAVRVSMGSVFLVPWMMWDGSDAALYAALRTEGFRTVAMALTDDSVTLSDPTLQAEPRLAIVMGTEGDGLPHDSICDADYVVRIPMAHGVDSLNVAAASAVAFYALTQ